jgi:hypothetical protein
VARKGSGRRPVERRVRVRSRPLAEIDAEKVALAVWMMARRLVAERDEVADGVVSPRGPARSGGERA